jgi:hypothetical protein
MLLCTYRTPLLQSTQIPDGVSSCISNASARRQAPLGYESFAVSYQVAYYYIVLQTYTRCIFNNPKSTQVWPDGNYSRYSGNKFPVLPLTLKPREILGSMECLQRPTSSAILLTKQILRNPENRKSGSGLSKRAPFNAACRARLTTISLTSSPT